MYKALLSPPPQKGPGHEATFEYASHIFASWPRVDVSLQTIGARALTDSCDVGVACSKNPREKNLSAACTADIIIG